MTPDYKGPWIALYTKTARSETFNGLTCVERSVFLQGFLLAARMEYDCSYKGHFYHILPGQFVISQRDLAEQCGEGCTRQIVRSTIDKLVAAQTWTHSRAKSGAQSPSLITFINWGVYQRPLTQTTQSRTHRTTQLQPTDAPQPLIKGGENASLHGSYKVDTKRPSLNGSKIESQKPQAQTLEDKTWAGISSGSYDPHKDRYHQPTFNPDKDEDKER